MNTQERAARGAAAAAAFLGVPAASRDAALDAIASALAASRDEIEAANRADAAAAADSGLPAPLLKRLGFTGKKIDDAVEGIRALRLLPDPLDRVLEARLLDEGLELRRVSCPIGLVATIFESRPDALVQMSCLAAKSGNAMLLKGGSEAARTNRVLSSIIAGAGETAGLPSGWLGALETREEIGELLRLDEYVDLVVPRGSKEFVARIQETSRIPVLGHSDGVCHVYVHEDADPAMARDIAVDSKTQYPAVCNAAEVLLLHRAFAERHITAILEALEAKGVALELCPESADLYRPTRSPEAPAPTIKADDDWSVEYLDLRMAVKVVGSLPEAIAHINRYGSGHTDAIVCESANAAKAFLRGVDSSSVFHNASTRFSDGYRYGLGAEVGISTGKLHARGPMGLEGLTTYKWLLSGSGQTVAPYAAGEKRFVHRDLPLAGAKESR